MEGSALLHLPEGMLIEQIHITENGLVIEVVATHPQSCCPLCSQTSSSIHSHYRRVLRDAPCAGRRVQLFLTARQVEFLAGRLVERVSPGRQDQQTTHECRSHRTSPKNE